MGDKKDHHSEQGHPDEVCQRPDQGQGQSDDQSGVGLSGLSEQAHGQDPMSPATVRLKDAVGRPTGAVPGGELSIAGGSGGSAPGSQITDAKLSSSYPPISVLVLENRGWTTGGRWSSGWLRRVRHFLPKYVVLD